MMLYSSINTMKQCSLCLLRYPVTQIINLPYFNALECLAPNRLCFYCKALIYEKKEATLPALPQLQSIIHGGLYDINPLNNTHSALLQAFKYRRHILFGKILTASLVQHIMLQTLHKPRPDFLVIIPAHQQRLYERGFSQTRLIGQWLSSFLNIPLLPLLKRHGTPKTQAGLSKQDRFENIRDTFAANPDIELPVHAHIALIDDVLTTGATLTTAANAIEKVHPSTTLDAWTLLYRPLEA